MLARTTAKLGEEASKKGGQVHVLIDMIMSIYS